ncbi:hypothetical protein Syun_027096 [Stephania yunnanensis]|uniref:WD repeat-containing protein 25 n=1 Tax=Stephania yunnanensis TaxID=152371 RepID=A0AAP0EF17_9MAGN
MDLLRSAYSTNSDEELENPTPTKRFRHQNQPTSSRPLRPNSHLPNRPSEPLIPGRYVSKRERALLLNASSSSATTTTTTTTPTSTANDLATPSVGSISSCNLRPDISSSLKVGAKGAARGQIPEKLSIVLNGHTKPVWAYQNSPLCSHLLASAGMDHSVYVWNVWSREDQKKARIFNFHNTAIKDVRWSPQGLFLLSCGYDCTSRLIDVEKGTQTQFFKEDQTVDVVKFHPDNFNLFLSGGSNGLIRLWDIRAGRVALEYKRGGLGPILDVEFSLDGKQFISSADITNGFASENSIIVWDVSRQIPLSNQVYVEAYTCPCIRYHPFDALFVAQSNGNYIAIFSSAPPFRLDKYKRYEKHAVSGFPIKCNFNSDGQILVSGSSDGCIYFYSSKTSELLRKIKAYEQACVDVAFHPRLPNVIASCSWNGDVSVYE